MVAHRHIDSASLERILRDHRAWLKSQKESGVRADLSGASLKGADLAGIDLREAYARTANLEKANLEGADLTQANLREANLRFANLRGARLHLTNLLDADLRDADLTDARGMTEARMRQPVVNERTKLPPLQRGKMPQLKTEKLLKDNE